MCAVEGTELMGYFRPCSLYSQPLASSRYLVVRELEDCVLPRYTDVGNSLHLRRGRALASWCQREVSGIVA